MGAYNPLLLAVVLGNIMQIGGNTRPPTPSWPDQFTIQLEVLVEEYGPDWNSTGVLYYDWTTKTFRSDYIDWCLPLFGSTAPRPRDKSDYYTCSFLATNGSTFFVNHTASTWEEDECCLFEQGLACVPPDWMSACQYNGTAEISGVKTDVWWLPGTSDPNNECVGYWDSVDPPHEPVRFFGISSLGPTILNYSGFKVGPPPPNVSLALPNKDSCFKECEPPLLRNLAAQQMKIKPFAMSPHFPWPYCPPALVHNKQ